MHFGTDGSRMLVVEVAGLRVAFPVEVVREVLRMPALCALPGAPAPIVGVVDLRGTVVPVLDLRLRLDLWGEPPALDQRLVAVELATGPLLLWVDDVHGLVALPSDTLEPLDGQLGTSPYIAGVARTAEGLLLVHDVDAFLGYDESEMLERALVAQAKA